jgi:hypothetical protein
VVMWLLHGMVAGAHVCFQPKVCSVTECDVESGVMCVFVCGW